MDNNFQAEITKRTEPRKFTSQYIDRIAHSIDASFFQRIPEAVFFPENETDILTVFELSQKNKIPLTFRAAATSLSGQTIGSGLIVDISRGFRNYSIDDEGKRIKLEPAIVLDHANLFLKGYGKRIGPDPASGKACMIGGVVANNASGITSGTVFNAYKTVKNLRFILPSGTVVDTSVSDADQLLKMRETTLYQTLVQIRDEIRSDVESTDKIKHLFSMKNTVGYSLNAFIDYDRPVDILAHLMIGSEGTLGFISEVEFKTIEDKPLKSASILGFKTLEEAGKAVTPLADSGMTAIEILSASAIAIVKKLPGMPGIIQEIPDNGAALLIEAHGKDETDINSLIIKAQEVIKKLSIDIFTPFISEETERLKLWKARKSLFATIGGNRPKGSTVITEDVVVPKDKLVNAVTGISNLLKKFKFDDGSVIFGHAKDGSLHFNFSVDFGDEERTKAFIDLSDELASLICDELNGALKGEHGTGRAVVSYVKQQWGEKLYSLMKKIKQIIDPGNLFNPGVLIDLEESGYPHQFKSNTIVEPVIDHCVDCGFCESQCPSRFLTLTPRQRIVVWREIQRLKNSGTDQDRLSELTRDYLYYGEATCAADGLCQLNCPLDINTGDFIKIIRSRNISGFARQISLILADHWSIVVSIGNRALTMSSAFSSMVGQRLLAGITVVLNRLNRRIFPVWNPSIPRGTMKSYHPQPDKNWDFIYFPSCINRMMGPYKEEDRKKSVINALFHICELSGIRLKVPEGINDHCCGLPFSSKGYHDAFIRSAEKMTEFLYEQSEAGKYPILVDTSPCTYTMRNYGDVLIDDYLEKWNKLQFMDIVSFLNDVVIKDKTLNPLEKRVALHPVCSVKKMGLEDKFHSIAKRCSANVAKIPITGCCATAGDRGFHYPELTKSATKIEADELIKSNAEGFYSSSRTCETGMSSASGKPFESIVFLVDEYLTTNKLH